MENNIKPNIFPLYKTIDVKSLSSSVFHSTYSTIYFATSTSHQQVVKHIQGYLLPSATTKDIVK